jgi:aminoglycoside phosphotransferase family enzyme
MESQKIVTAFMEPGTYDEEVAGDIRLIQTHISWVFLTGKYVYKVKKPANFGFLDFSTLAKRKKYCELELELNKRLCPDIYLDVLPVNENKGELKINGAGETVEYVLKMKQLPQDRLMNKLLELGEVDKGIIDKIALIISDFHSKAETSGEIAEFGSLEKLRFNWNENFDQTKEFAGELIAMEDLVSARKIIESFIEGNASLFEKRTRENKIRRIHGDLHSGNIFIVDGKPCIFDCIEFNLRFSCLDVAADVAFLSMDLDFQNQMELSGFLVNKYVEYSGDDDLGKVIDFYKCYYAWVRGKVNAFRLKEKLDDNEKREIKETSKKYFELALRYSKSLR